MATMLCKVQYLDDTDPFSSTSTNFPEPTRPPTYTFLTNVPLQIQLAGVKRLLKAPHKLEDCTLQLCRNTGNQYDYGLYLDLEASLDDQAEELEGFTDSKRNAIILRTQLSVRVSMCIDKLLNSSDKELRRALFSLKQIFQDDKDLVHEFVNNGGLDCFITVGRNSDQNYQNYILRALGQVMLYVDGMNGVIGHNLTVQWLYSLTTSKHRMVVKTALKLLLVFVEYIESNSSLLLDAIEHVDSTAGLTSWSNVMTILDEKEGNDTELLIYAMTLVNKTLNAIGDQEVFFDVTDAMEEQGMERIVLYHTQRGPGVSDPQLVEQLQIYEAALRHEDEGEFVVVGGGTVDSGIVSGKTPQRRIQNADDRRKSKRFIAQKGGALADIQPIISIEGDLSEQMNVESDTESGSSSVIGLPLDYINRLKRGGGVGSGQGGEDGGNSEEGVDDPQDGSSTGRSSDDCLNIEDIESKGNLDRRRRRERQKSHIQEMLTLGRDAFNTISTVAPTDPALPPEHTAMTYSSHSVSASDKLTNSPAQSNFSCGSLTSGIDAESEASLLRLPRFGTSLKPIETVRKSDEKETGGFGKQAENGMDAVTCRQALKPITLPPKPQLRPTVDSSNLVAQGYIVVDPGSSVSARTPRPWNTKREDKNSDLLEKYVPKPYVSGRPSDATESLKRRVTRPESGDTNLLLASLPAVSSLSIGALNSTESNEAIDKAEYNKPVSSACSSATISSTDAFVSKVSSSETITMYVSPSESFTSVNEFNLTQSGRVIATPDQQPIGLQHPSMIKECNLTESGRVSATPDQQSIGLQHPTTIKESNLIQSGHTNVPLDQQPIGLQHPSTIDHHRVVHQRRSVDNDVIRNSTTESATGRRPMNCGASLDHGAYEGSSILSVADLNEGCSFKELIQKRKENLTSRKSLKKHPGGADFSYPIEDNLSKSLVCEELGESDYAPPTEQGPVLSPPTHAVVIVDPPARIASGPKDVEVISPKKKKVPTATLR